MNWRLPIALGLIAWMAAPVGSVNGQTLEEAMAAAYGNNPTLMAGRAALRATDEEVPQALANWRPDIAVSTDISRADTFSNARTTTAKDQTRTPRGADLTITQPLFRGFRTVAAVRQAENEVKAARARLHGTEQGILLAAVTAFMGVLRDQAVLELRISNEQVLTRQLEATQDRFQVGEITRTDVFQAQARLAGATAARIQAEGDLEVSRAAYKNVVGTLPGKLSAPKPLIDLPANMDAATKLALQYHPDVIAALFAERKAHEQVAGIRGELLPSVSLVGTLSRDFETAGNTSRVDEASIKATVSVPLFQQGDVYSRLRQARQIAGQRRLGVDQARRDVTEAATQTWEVWTAARARISSLKTQVKASEVALEGVQREAAVGSRTVLDVLDAEQELLDANVNLVRAQRDEIVAIFELKSAVGALTARQLNLSVDLYDPETHYQEVRDRWTGGNSSGDAEGLSMPDEMKLVPPKAKD